MKEANATTGIGFFCQNRYLPRMQGVFIASSPINWVSRTSMIFSSENPVIMEILKELAKIPIL